MSKENKTIKTQKQENVNDNDLALKETSKSKKKIVRNVSLITCSVLIVIAFITFLICSLARPVRYANALFSMDLVAVQNEEGKWGYVSQNGNTKIEFKFDSALNFSDNGLALVKVNDKYGYINIDGKFKINAIYEEALSFESGVAIVKFEGKYGVIDSKGKVITTNPSSGDVAEEFLKGYFYEDIKPFENGYAAVKIDGKFGLINIKGEKVLDCTYDDITSISNGILAYQINEKYGYMRIDDKTLITGTLYDEANAFDDKGYAVVRYSDSSGDDKVVIIDTDGNFAYDKYNLKSVKRLSNGYMIVELGDKFGLINSKLETVIEAKYQTLNFEMGEYLVYSTTGDKFGYLNFKGEVVCEEKYYFASNFNKLAVVKEKEEDNFYIVLNDKFEKKFTLECDELRDFSKGLAVLRKNGQYGYVNENGEIVVEPKLRFATNVYEDKYAIVMTSENKYGIINTEGKYVVKPYYSNIVFYSYAN